MATKTAFLPGMRIEPNVKAALDVISEQMPGDLADQIRFAAEKRIKDRLQELERRIAAAEHLGTADAEAHEFLQALRDAYAGTSDD